MVSRVGKLLTSERGVKSRSEDLAWAKGGRGPSLLETGIGLRYKNLPVLSAFCSQVIFIHHKIICSLMKRILLPLFSFI